MSRRRPLSVVFGLACCLFAACDGTTLNGGNGGNGTGATGGTVGSGTPVVPDAGGSGGAGGAGPTDAATDQFMCQPLGGACVACPNGYLKDANGCATCKCAPMSPPPTCGPVCDIYCQYGNVLDSQGCPTCSCNPSPVACTKAECGVPPPVDVPVCASKTAPTNLTCERDANGKCTWRMPACPPPPPTCTLDQCKGPAPKSINYICPDGRTIAGPACVPDAAGTCGWTIVACPAQCVDNVACIKGSHWDPKACLCVPDSPGVACPPCPSADVCFQQIGGPAVPSGPAIGSCGQEDPVCVKTAKDPCTCLPASNGTCVTAASGLCTCDNHIR